MKTSHSNNDHYRLTDFLLVPGAWLLTLSLVYVVIIKLSFLNHSFHHIH